MVIFPDFFVNPIESLLGISRVTVSSSGILFLWEEVCTLKVRDSQIEEGGKNLPLCLVKGCTEISVESAMETLLSVFCDQAAG